MKEGGSFHEHIIGGTIEEKKETAAMLQRVFEEPDKKLGKYELKKTSEDIKIIERTELIVDETVKRYGGDPKPLPLDNIYVLKSGSVSTMTNGKLHDGVYHMFGSKIGIEKGKSELMFARGIAHELFHLKSYKSVRSRSGGDASPYRSGFSMSDIKDQDREPGPDERYFKILEEAIVAECTKRFIEKLRKESPFREEAEEIKTINDWVVEHYRHAVSATKGETKEKMSNMLGWVEEGLIFVANPQNLIADVLKYSDDENERQNYTVGAIRALYERGGAEFMERYEERKMLYRLLDELIEKSNGKFNDRDEVFDEFARANFSGNYLPLARTVESILGKGSFRKIADEFAIKNEKENVS